jgi:hypothetical protein
MSAKGFAFEDYVLFRYSFSDCKPGEYLYRIELLENLPGHPESQSYLKFMAENGATPVSNWFRWVYFQKKAADGPFDIYSDISSKIAHYKRILTLWLPLICVDIFMGIANVRRGLPYALGGIFPNGSESNFFLGILCIAIGIFIFIPWNRTRLKLKRLKQEQFLME